MNMKVDWATTAVRTLHQLLAGQEIGFTLDEVDSLLSRYAGKALDLPYPLRQKRSGDWHHGTQFYMEAASQASLRFHLLCFLNEGSIRRHSSLFLRQDLGLSRRVRHYMHDNTKLWGTR